jgi:hypothetical protein
MPKLETPVAVLPPQELLKRWVAESNGLMAPVAKTAERKAPKKTGAKRESR